ncbi:Nucleoplasmin-2 [Manis pentadactyla]|nr:Nucleoplasmin-2 [Manis pentadactyla]
MAICSSFSFLCSTSSIDQKGDNSHSLRHQRGDESHGDSALSKPGGQEDEAITIALLHTFILSMVTMTGLEPSLPVSFQFWDDSGLVFLSGWECYDSSDLSWEEGEEEEDDEI